MALTLEAGGVWRKKVSLRDTSRQMWNKHVRFEFRFMPMFMLPKVHSYSTFSLVSVCTRFGFSFSLSLSVLLAEFGRDWDGDKPFGAQNLISSAGGGCICARQG